MYLHFMLEPTDCVFIRFVVACLLYLGVEDLTHGGHEADVVDECPVSPCLRLVRLGLPHRRHLVLHSKIGRSRWLDYR